MYKSYIETKHENRDRLGKGWLFIDTPRMVLCMKKEKK